MKKEKLHPTLQKFVGIIKADKNGWISVKDELPEIDKNVFVYYELTSKNEKEVFKYREIGKISSITDYGSSKTIDWTDNEYRSINPTHWQPLPEPPDSSPKENL